MSLPTDPYSSPQAHRPKSRTPAADDLGDLPQPPRIKKVNRNSGLLSCGCLGGTILLVGGYFVLLVLGAVLTQLGEGGVGGAAPLSLSAGPVVGVVRVEGPITSSRQFTKQLTRLRQSPRLKALVIRVDSPGGAVGASEEMWREVSRLKEETSMPVVISMGNAAASGGYYLATAGDRIYANAGTITGSIGVIVQGLGLGQLMERSGLESRTIKSGELKDAGSPFRDMSPEERAYFQGVVYDMYRQFFRRVLASRHQQIEKALQTNGDVLEQVVMSDQTKRPGAGLEWEAFTTGTMAMAVGATQRAETALRRLADGRVITGEQALAVGLVDAIGNLGDATREAARLAKLEPGKYIVHDPDPRPDLSFLFGSMARQALSEAIRPEVSVEFR